MNNNIALIPNQILVGEQLYSEAINIILSSAQRELLIFDQDLIHCDFASKEKFDLFQQFLNKSISSHLTIILQDAGYFQTKCPFLVNLLTIYRHKMVVYQTNHSAKHAKDCFILADEQNYIKRIHIDQARFKFGLSDISEASLLSVRFKELLNATQDGHITARLDL